MKFLSATLILFSTASALACPTGTQCRKVEIQIDIISTLKLGQPTSASDCAKSAKAAGQIADLDVLVETASEKTRHLVVSQQMSTYVKNRHPDAKTFTFKPKQTINDIALCVPAKETDITYVTVNSLQTSPVCSDSENEFILKSFCAPNSHLLTATPTQDQSSCGKNREAARASFNSQFWQMAPEVKTQIQQKKTSVTEIRNGVQISTQVRGNVRVDPVKVRVSMAGIPIARVKTEEIKAQFNVGLENYLSWLTRYPHATHTDALATVIIRDNLKGVYERANVSCNPDRDRAVAGSSSATRE